MLDLAALRDFVAVIRDGGFSAAAKRMGVPKSTVSKRVQMLETALGVRLIERSTRALRLTPEGAALHKRAQSILADVEDTERMLGQNADLPQGLLRLSVPQLFGQTKMAAIAAICRQRHPNMTLDIVLGDTRVDLIEDGFDAAIRVGPLPDSSFIARTFAVARNVIAAAPERVETVPGKLEDLQTYPALGFNTPISSKVQWSLHRTTGQPVEITIEPVVSANSLTVLRDLCAAGTGIALLPQFVIADDLEQGRLVRLLPEWAGPDVPLSIVYPSGRLVSARLRAFIEVLVEAFPNRSL